MSDELTGANEPDDHDFYVHFCNLSNPCQRPDFNNDYEKSAIQFLTEYDAQLSTSAHENDVVTEIINQNFNEDEIEECINHLKNNKSPGIDGVTSEFIKMCKGPLIPYITEILNYIIEFREFPKVWACGIRSAIFKSGKRNEVDNYRGITILPIMEKIFEIAVYKRLYFVNEAFDDVDRYNGGFLCDSRTSDNLFIINGLIERQLALGKSFFVCFVDFSKAFDLVNRHILFYKIIRNGWKGRVIDTIRDLYAQSHFRVKRGGKISPPILNQLGVNQGGVASGLLFRKYMQDISDYLSKAVGVCISNEIIVHLLWADDLILFSDTTEGLQKQLNGLYKYCSNNHMIVNETKTKVMCFGRSTEIRVNYNGVPVQQVGQYKYLGNILKSVSKQNQDVFASNYDYLCNQSLRAIYSFRKKIKRTGALPPKIMFYIFDALVHPILTYGSDVWGFNRKGLTHLDKIFLHYARCVLQVKSTTCNTIVYGECGQFPPSVHCQINTLCLWNRLANTPANKIVRQVYDELKRLGDQGFQTWITKACELVRSYGLDPTTIVCVDKQQFKKHCKQLVMQRFVDAWQEELHGLNKPILRTYSVFKSDFVLECHLNSVKDLRYRVAITKLCTGSHVLEIERGRYQKPKVPRDLRLCRICNVVEDEEHFVTSCNINHGERSLLYSIMTNKIPYFGTLSDNEIFLFLITSNDPQILTWFGKFLHRSFIIRNEVLISKVDD